MARSSRPRKRQRGSIDVLPSGALRVRVFAGRDPLTGRRNSLTEIIDPGPRAADLAERARTRLLNQVDERRNPKTNATLDQLLDKHLDLIDVEGTTLRTYRGYVDTHIRPLVGSIKVGAFDADLLDSFYAELRRCRAHCDRRRYVEHRTSRAHECDDRCRRHVCKPLGDATIRQIHFILSGAFKRALRWRWVSVNPMTQAQPPAAPKPNPRPPSATEAAAILNEAWKDPDWGTLVWLAMTTGARRGELCALRWRHVNLDNGVLEISSSVAQDSSRTWEKATKTHQQRRIALDPDTVTVLQEHKLRRSSEAKTLGLDLAEDAYVFALDPGNRTHLLPDSVSQRYGKLVARLDIDTHLHNLRHYSATELIAAGVDVRTVAGRLGHGGGGTTTLRVYSAWVSESDQRASHSLFARLPTRPEPTTRTELAKTQPQAPYEKVAASLRADILDGALKPGEPLPTLTEIASSAGVSVGTAHRATTLLRDWGLVEPGTARRPAVVSSDPKS
ncbi:tyrosine-type recombinase/integrase [Actinopolymorpha sp. B11F2]|uniref:tyrosine-type recombinase/integrase n=1 Tax=Actinopolymorpha sp. B11F2 TaxID=3160862 RepID=UPI0032E472DF